MDYSEYIAENLEKSLDYSEYIAENLEKSLDYSKYTANDLKTIEELKVEEKINIRNKTIDAILEDSLKRKIITKLLNVFNKL